jgi:hypothetical protein
MSTIYFYTVMALAALGAMTALAWCGSYWLTMWRVLDEWSRSRAYCLVAEAIIDHEVDRGVHVAKALRFGLRIMRKSEVWG